MAKQAIEYSNLPKRAFDDLSLMPEKVDLEAFKTCKNFSENILDHVKQGDGLYIHGFNKGNGKTTWAFKIIIKYIEQLAKHGKGWDNDIPIYYLNVSEMFDQYRSNMEDKEYTKAIEDAIYGADLVIFDDVGVEAPTTWVKNKLYTYINYRYNNKKSIIFTSNLTLTQLGAKIDDRVADRISQVCRPIQFQGQSRRFNQRWWEDKT